MLDDSPAANNSTVLETLELLEWPLLCKNLATFASTEMGRHCSERIKIPKDIQSSKSLLSETLEIGELDSSIDGGISFSGIYNIKDHINKCEKGGVILGNELLEIAETLSASRRLRRIIYDQTIRPKLSKLFTNLVTLPDLDQKLRLGLEEGGRIADRSSPTLSSLRIKVRNLNFQRKEILTDILRRKSQILHDNIIGKRNDRSVISVKVGLSSQLPGIIHDSSSSGNTVFVEPQSVINLGNEISRYKSKIRKEEFRLLKEWSQEVAIFAVQIKELCKVILRLDMALTRARYGECIGGINYSLLDNKDEPFVIQSFKHPLLLWKQMFEQGENVVPISLEINSNLKVIAITGPNTGGKTIILKSFGLALLMAKSGLLLPCKGNISLPWCNLILADIGDEQSLQQSLSTFSGHLNRVKNILELINASPGPDIILLDEIGAGTDPTEGAALAIALLKKLAEKARLTIVSTHLGELKAIKYSDSRFENASVAFDAEKMKPTYYLQWGIPGSSNAIAIAKRLGIQSDVISKAESLLLPDKLGDVNQMIVGLEKEKKRQQESTEEAAMLLARAEILHEELLKNWQEQTQYTQDLKQKKKDLIESSINSAQKEVSSLINRLRERGANGETARIAGQRLRGIAKEHCSSSYLQNNRNCWTPKVGEFIRLIALGKPAEVISISENGLQLTLLCGSFRSKVGLNDIESLEGLKPVPPDLVVEVKTKRSIRKASSIRTSGNTIDVRGLRVNEAEVVLDDYFRARSGAIWVVHGIGSGKLKRGLRLWIKTLEYVDKVIDADASDGGLGCSVVWLNH